MTAAPGGHARHRLDPQLSGAVRLSIMATLVTVQDIEFSALRDVVEVTDSTLSKQLAALESTDYVRITKGYFGKRPRTWVSCSAVGRRSYDNHVIALEQLLGIQAP